jgi:hypothetical protein
MNKSSNLELALKRLKKTGLYKIEADYVECKTHPGYYLPDLEFTVKHRSWTEPAVMTERELINFAKMYTSSPISKTRGKQQIKRNTHAKSRAFIRNKKNAEDFDEIPLTEESSRKNHLHNLND